MTYRLRLMRRGLGLVVVLAMLVGAACKGSDETANRPRATVPTTGPPTTTTAPADPFAIPATIDEAYVERVLAELDRIDGDATRAIIANGDFVREATDALAAVYHEDELNAQLDLWNDEIRAGLTGYRRPPGNVHTEVTTLLASTRECVFAEVTRDYAETAEIAAPPRRSFVALRPGSDPKGLNRTPWKISLTSVPADGSTPPNPCAGQ